VYSGGGCFSAIGGNSTGVNVTALRWDATPAELAELLAAVATALRAAGLRVDDLGTGCTSRRRRELAYRPWRQRKAGTAASTATWARSGRHERTAADMPGCTV
jgi:hypothetical protein